MQGMFQDLAAAIISGNLNYKHQPFCLLQLRSSFANWAKPAGSWHLHQCCALP